MFTATDRQQINPDSENISFVLTATREGTLRLKGFTSFVVYGFLLIYPFSLREPVPVQEGLVSRRSMSSE